MSPRNFDIRSQTYTAPLGLHEAKRKIQFPRKQNPFCVPAQAISFFLEHSREPRAQGHIELLPRKKVPNMNLTVCAQRKGFS